MRTTTMTPTQTKLWKISDAELKRIGGIGAINRNPNPEIRILGKTEGTREWALLKSIGLSSGCLDDATCQQLIDILS